MKNLYRQALNEDKRTFSMLVENCPFVINHKHLDVNLSIKEIDPWAEHMFEGDFAIGMNNPNTYIGSKSYFFNKNDMILFKLVWGDYL